MITLVAVWWILQHPFGTNWDEANYLNQAIQDRSALNQGLWDWVKAILRRDSARPPAYRILIVPITQLLGANSVVLRLSSWLSFTCTLFLMYLVGKRLCERAVGGFIACFLLACPILIGPNMRFYVDYSLYLAIAGVLYCLFCQWDNPTQHPRYWIGLGLFLGLGAMAKPTILLIVGPMLVVVMLLCWLKWITGPTLPALFKSYGLATMVMAPWWVLNGQAALEKAFSSGGNVRDALGPEGELGTLLHWGYVFLQSITGPIVGGLAGAIAVSFCFKLCVLRQSSLDRSQQLALVVCLAGAIPLACIAAFGVNHNPRLIAPLLLPLGLAVGLMVYDLGWLTHKLMAPVAIVMIVAQVSVMLLPQGGSDRYQEGDTFAQTHNWGNPTSVMRLEEQWDWSLLHELATQYQMDTPKIGYLGSAKTLNPSQLLLPWVMADETANIVQLWNFTTGPIDWHPLMKRAMTKDILITFVPEPLSTVDNFAAIENQYNLEFSERIANTGQFMPLKILEMGKFSTSKVHVFLRKGQET
ncbi:glycosyltransferase family 39 protein [Leptothoe spongobia TAU-MAC 1115]|uniref:Glycosyltransferase family 39 protein n=1 Tax=Leptothoe spongobia TAU-MAC 1115 TaxID=1967444 RepID=A0A947DKS5_9CYAN|nr:glycosyltransferase family 39 protein [Leptothoe spongobia TAU-MAC 1115]